MANTGLFIGFVVMVCALGADSADPVLCATQLHKDLIWYDAVVKNITYQSYMGNQAKLAAMCHALYLVVNRAVQLGCPLSRISELRNRQRNLFAAGATTCLAARPQTQASQLQTSIPRPLTTFTPGAAVLPLGNPAMANINMYNNLDPCDVRISNCYLQFQVNLLMRFRLRNHTCNIIESFADCLLALRHCGFPQFLKPLIIKQAVSSTQFAFWEAKECPIDSYMPTTASIIRDTTTARLPGTPRGPESTNPYSNQISTDCGKATFKCVNGNCVRLDNVCNGLDNCGDASDEIGCQNKELRNALEIDKIFVKYNCYDAMSMCTALHVRPLLLLLQAGQLSSLDNLCKASNKVFHCAVHESCPLSAEDRDKLSSLLIQSFEQLVSRKTCQLKAVNSTNTSGSHNINHETTTSSTMDTVYTSTPPGVINLNTLFTHLATDFPSTASTAESTNFTITADIIDFTNVTSTPDITDLNTTSSPDITDLNTTSNPGIIYFNTTSNPGIIDFNTTSNPGIIDFNTTSNPGIIDLNTTSNQDIIYLNTSSNPDIIGFNTTSNPGITGFNTTSNPDIIYFNTTSNPDIIDFNTTSNPGIIDLNTTSNQDIIDLNTTSNPDIIGFNTTSNPDIIGFNTTSNPDITDFNTTRNPGINITDFNTTSNPDIIYFNTTSNPDIIDFTTTSNPDITDLNTTSNPGITDFNTTSNLDITDFNTTSNPDITDFTTTSNPGITDFNTTSNLDITDFNTTSNLDITDFNTTSNPDITDFNTTSNPDITDFTNTTSSPITTPFTKTPDNVITTNTPDFSNPTYPTTSPNDTQPQNPGNSSIVTSPCVKSCDGLQSGNYQSCAGCNMFATCSEGVLYDKRLCPAALLWDDVSKRCDLSSSTCQAPQACVSSCDGLQSGDYQSCQGCDVYLTCNNGVMQDNRSCHAGLLWNDINKRCEHFSPTCVPSGRKTSTHKCVQSCEGLASGNYQSCLGCNVYASCDNGILTDDRPCPNFMLWDDTVKRCENTSETCAKTVF